eukprot:7020805-Lingulodinium_polyedra.AAC.1
MHAEVRRIFGQVLGVVLAQAQVRELGPIRAQRCGDMVQDGGAEFPKLARIHVQDEASRVGRA